MKKIKFPKSAKFSLVAIALLSVTYSATALVISEDFRKGSTTNNWYVPLTGGIPPFLASNASGTVCLTAGTVSSSDSTVATAVRAGIPQKCTDVSDAQGSGALRLTRAAKSQSGGIVSSDVFPTNEGVDITFTTYVWGGNGADGMVFYLADGSAPVTMGYNGGTLGYMCGVTSSYYGNYNSGVWSGYIGIGMDEFGNFYAARENGRRTNSIVVRGAGNVNYYYYQDPNYFLTDLYKAMGWGTPSDSKKAAWKNAFTVNKLTSASTKNFTGNAGGSGIYRYTAGREGVFSTNYLCSPKDSQMSATAYRVQVPKEFTLNGKDPVTLVTTGSTNPAKNEYRVYRYNILESVKSANSLYSNVGSRGKATPITYKIKITPANLLSVWYSYNGGEYSTIMKDVDITSSNGPLPSSFRFGFAAATGGSTNNHEVACFKAAPSNNSEGTATTNLPDGEYKTDSQVYAASYNSLYWNGYLTASAIVVNTDTNVPYVNPTATWDASCVLTGGYCTNTTKQTTVQAPDDRNFISWDGSKGIPLASERWDDLSTVQKSYFKYPTEAQLVGKNRFSWVLGDRSREGATTEITEKGTFRERSSVLADIINSSPTWVGYPNNSDYSNVNDYKTFADNYKSRTNVVYVGANDGFLHAFRSGSYDADGNFVPGTTNDGKELFAYMPLSVMSRIYNQDGYGTRNFTGNYYAHNYYVDGTPGTGDVYYDGAWHTWLLGGLGAGGATVYALDITDPNKFSRDNAGEMVKGEWSYNKSNPVWKYLGNTYGTPQFGRLEKASWGAVFGNGWCSNTDAANGTDGKNGNCTALASSSGIYAMTIGSGGNPDFKFITTNTNGSTADPNGIAEVTPYDANGDGEIDYVYAGDIKGNVWRFNLHAEASKWNTIQPQLVFSSGTAQPISTKILVSKQKNRVILNFGTGLKKNGYLDSSNTYATGIQSFYGIEDKELSGGNMPTGIGSKTAKIVRKDLQVQTIDAATGALSRNTVDWTKKSGWYMDFPSSVVDGSTEYEQIIWNPYLSDTGALVLNSYINASTTRISCDTASSGGYTYALNALTGEGLTDFWVDSSIADSGAYRQELGATGSPTIIKINGKYYMLVKNKDGSSSLYEVNPTLFSGVTVRRMSWRQLFN